VFKIIGTQSETIKMQANSVRAGKPTLFAISSIWILLFSLPVNGLLPQSLSEEFADNQSTGINSYSFDWMDNLFRKYVTDLHDFCSV
jgi:hypothetical protein